MACGNRRQRAENVVPRHHIVNNLWDICLKVELLRAGDTPHRVRQNIRHTFPRTRGRLEHHGVANHWLRCLWTTFVPESNKYNYNYPRIYVGDHRCNCNGSNRIPSVAILVCGGSFVPPTWIRRDQNISNPDHSFPRRNFSQLLEWWRNNKRNKLCTQYI